MTGESSPSEPTYSEMLVASLREQLQPLYISDEVVDQIEMADCEVYGVRYFRNLFSEDPSVTLGERLTSAYVGATANGYEYARAQSYKALKRLGELENIEDHFIKEIDKAINQERRIPNYNHISRLENANKLLGKSVPKRFIGKIASSLIAHSHT